MIRRNVFSPCERGTSRSEVIDFPFKAEKADNQIEVIDFIREEAVAFDKADVIVSGGRGIGGKEGFEELEDLAEALRKLFDTVMVGCSRPAVDLGWVPANRQIGLTGVMVSPNIYFAIGISGAMQHLIGMIKSRKIVAINTDPSSNIFTVADYGVVGDFRKVIPAFKRKLSELSHEKT